jgi:glutamine amidotransferase
MIGIVDYGMGNLLSVYNAFELLGADVAVFSEAKEILTADRIVLPGVGAFGDCIWNLSQKGLLEALNEAVIDRGTPFLGVCLGMQMVAKRSFEGGEFSGLGWIDADVVRIAPPDPGIRVPHMGWDDIEYSDNSDLFKGLPQSPDFYFVHSYYMKCNDEENVVATCEYGEKITAAVQKDNLFATQFHPEKSQDYGLQILENFLEWSP